MFVLLLLQGGLGLLQRGGQLLLLPLQPLPLLLYLVYGPPPLADLLHDVPDLLAEALVLPPHLLQIPETLVVAILDTEEFAGDVPALSLAEIQLRAQTICLGLPVMHNLIK